MKPFINGLILGALLCCTTAQAALSDITLSLESGKRTRTAQLHLPDGADTTKPLPLVIVLHGGGGAAESTMKQTGLSAVADREHFIAAYPNGTSRLFSNRLLTWNAGSCCAYAQENDVDDVGFIRALVIEIQHRYLIDPKRIYATGLSNGGMMSYRLACEMSDVLAAIAPVSAVQVVSRCTPTQPVSVIHIHGTADENVTLDGHPGKKALTHDVRPPVADTLKFWTQHDGCSAAVSTQSGAVHRDAYTCKNGSAVEYLLITGGGHAWPGGERLLRALDEPSNALAASDTIWEFFKAHPKP
jgi:polyhydroxybutyrate depolymerase